MGYQISWLAAKRPKATLLDVLRLTDTGVLDEANESPFSVAELSDGWSIVWSNDVEWSASLQLEALAAETPVVIFMVFENAGISSMAYAGPDGVWSVSYGLEEDGVLQGDWPAELAPVALAAKHPFDVPIDLARALTGYEYSQVRYEWGEVRFTCAQAEEAAHRQGKA